MHALFTNLGCAWQRLPFTGRAEAEPFAEPTGTPGQGDFTPGLIATSTRVLIPFAFDITFTDLSTGESDTQAMVKGAGVNPKATVACTINYTNTDQGFSLVGSVTALLTPVR